MGIGTARGENRATEAARNAISSPLLEASIDGARGVLLNISGGSDLGLFEVHEAADIIAKAAHPDANIIFGAVVDDQLGDEVRVTVVASGFDRWTPAEEPLAVPQQYEEEESFESPVVEEEDEGQEWSAEPRYVFDSDTEEEDLDIPSFLRRP
jgi:cell division protein FtsZ